MANNSDGSIVLSVNIDTSTLKSQTDKISKEVLNALKFQTKFTQETEKANQALLKTELLQEKIATQQEKRNREQIKSEQTLRAERAKADKELERKQQAEANRIAVEERAAEQKRIAEVKLQQEQLKVANLELKNQAAQKKLEEPEVPQPENSYQELQGTIKVQEQALQSLKEKYASLVLQKQQNSDEAKKLKESIKNLSVELDGNRKKLEESRNAANVFDKSMSKVKNATNSAITGLKKFASALGIYLGLREIIRFSNEASKLASQQEANLKRLSMLYGEHAKEVYDFANANSIAFGMAKNAAYQAAADYGNLFSTFADGAESARLTNDMLKATAVIASQTGRTYEDVFEKIRSGLYGNTRAIDDLGITVRKAGLQQTQAFQIVSGGVKKWNDLTDAELQHARALGIIEQAYGHYGNTVLQTTALTRSQFNAAWSDFKATWGQAVNLVLIPILTVATRILVTITTVLQKIFHLTGNQLDTSSKVTANIGGAVAKQDDLTNSVGKTNKALKESNKELKKELASFDELEILSRDTANNADKSGGGSAGAGGGSAGAGGAGGGNGKNGNESFIDQGEIDAKLAAVAAIVGSALIGLGILVMLSGHPFYGLAMIGIGVVGVYTAVELSKTLDFDIQSQLENIFEIAGKVAFMLGCILMFIPGCWKYGLGLMALGASALGYSEILGGGDITTLKTKISEMILLAGLVAFMIGIVLLFLPGCWKFGLGLMVKGAIAVGFSAILGGEELKQALETFCTEHWKILYGVGIIMICVGVVLLFAAAETMWKYALTLIGIGIVDIVGTTLLGGTPLKQALETFCTEHWKILYGIGIIMICVGVVILFASKAKLWKYALTLIGIGAIDIIGTTEFGGDELKKAMTTFCEKYWKEIYVVSYLIFVVGVIMLFTPATLPYGLGLIVFSASVIGGATYFAWDKIKTDITTVTNSINTWIEQYDVLLFILGVIMLFTPAQKVGIGLLIKTGKKLFNEEDLSFTSLKTKLVEQLTNVYNAIEGPIDKIKNKFNEITGNKKVSVNYSSTGNSKGTVNAQAMPTVSYKVPALARGAVIPANRKFLAVLGDQTQGTNIEAPAELIKQMAKEAITEMGGVGVQNQVVREEHYYLDQTELMNVIYKLVKGGERINGTSLINQGGAI